MRGGISGDHFGIVVMQLADDGTRVNGLVCYSGAGEQEWLFQRTSASVYESCRTSRP